MTRGLCALVISCWERSMQQRLSTQSFLACGVIRPLLFVVVFLIEGATRRGYSPWRHAASHLSLGAQGGVSTLNIFICVLFLLCFPFGLKRAFSSGRGSVC